MLTVAIVKNNIVTNSKGSEDYYEYQRAKRNVCLSRL